jgi:hypothetical protein
MNARLIPLCIAAGALFAANPALAEGPGSADSMPGAVPPMPGNPAQAMPPMAMPPMPGAVPPGYQMPYTYPQGYGAPASYPPEYQQARENWIADCADRYRSEDRRDGHGGIIGGVLGAVVGGVVGNRIDKKGSRLAGTLIGAGAGGLAGAVIGSAIDRNNARKDGDEAVAWCEDYLARNTAQPGYGQPGYGYPAYGYAYPMAYAVPMMAVMVPVQRCHTHEVVEKIVERPVYRKILVHDKRVRIEPTKTVKYSKTGKSAK